MMRGEKDVNKVACITGATGGIGRAIAYKLAGEGYHLQLHYHRNRGTAIRLQKELHREDRHVQLFQADLGRPHEITNLIDALLPKPDILIHCAGLAQYSLFTDVREKEYEQMIQVHLTAPFSLTQGLLPFMVRKKWGRIIFITSVWGEAGAACEALYSMVKGGQNALAKALAKECASSGVTVNAVSPGAIETPMMASFTPEERTDLQQQIPMGRLGSPEEVAHAVHFLLEEGSRYMTGQVLRVNGGWYT